MTYDPNRIDSKYSTNTPACGNADYSNTKVGSCARQQPCVRTSSALAGDIEQSISSPSCSRGDCERSLKSSVGALLEKALAESVPISTQNSLLMQIVQELSMSISSMEESVGLLIARLQP